MQNLNKDLDYQQYPEVKKTMTPSHKFMLIKKIRNFGECQKFIIFAKEILEGASVSSSFLRK